MRFDEDDGVFVPLSFCRPGDLPANDDDLLCSGVLELGAKCICPCLDRGCRDFVFAALEAVSPRAPSI